jgi:hypothetical protein
MGQISRRALLEIDYVYIEAILCQQQLISKAALIRFGYILDAVAANSARHKGEVQRDRR